MPTLKFEDFELDTQQSELRRRGEPVALEPQVFELLLYLVENGDHVVSKDDIIEHVWHGRIVSDSALSSRINAVRKALDDDGKSQRLIRTISKRGFRFIGELAGLSQTASGAAAAPISAASDGAASSSGAVHQDIRFCRTADGAQLAYATSGSGMPVVKAANWLTHLEHDWNSPVWSEFLTLMSRDHRLIRYDVRGTGMSDWDVEDISFDAFVRDLETVVDTLELERFALIGISQGCAVSIAYAARHPERVSHLILHGGYAEGRLQRPSPEEHERARTIRSLMKECWGTKQEGFSKAFSALYIPDGTPEQLQWWVDLQRISATPENASRILDANNEINVVELLPRITAPTLVMHSKTEAVTPFEQARLIAASIRNARFVPIDSANHLVMPEEPAFAVFMDEILAFLNDGESGPAS